MAKISKVINQNDLVNVIKSNTDALDTIMNQVKVISKYIREMSDTEVKSFTDRIKYMKDINRSLVSMARSVSKNGDRLNKLDHKTISKFCHTTKYVVMNLVKLYEDIADIDVSKLDSTANALNAIQTVVPNLFKMIRSISRLKDMGWWARKGIASNARKLKKTINIIINELLLLQLDTTTAGRLEAIDKSIQSISTSLSNVITIVTNTIQDFTTRLKIAMSFQKRFKMGSIKTAFKFIDAIAAKMLEATKDLDHQKIRDVQLSILNISKSLMDVLNIINTVFKKFTIKLRLQLFIFGRHKLNNIKSVVRYIGKIFIVFEKELKDINLNSSIPQMIEDLKNMLHNILEIIYFVNVFGKKFNKSAKKEFNRVSDFLTTSMVQLIISLDQLTKTMEEKGFSGEKLDTIKKFIETLNEVLLMFIVIDNIVKKVRRLSRRRLKARTKFLTTTLIEFINGIDTVLNHLTQTLEKHNIKNILKNVNLVDNIFLKLIILALLIIILAPMAILAHALISVITRFIFDLQQIIMYIDQIKYVNGAIKDIMGINIVISELVIVGLLLAAGIIVFPLASLGARLGGKMVQRVQALMTQIDQLKIKKKDTFIKLGVILQVVVILIKIFREFAKGRDFWLSAMIVAWVSIVIIKILHKVINEINKLKNAVATTKKLLTIKGVVEALIKIVTVFGDNMKLFLKALLGVLSAIIFIKALNIIVKQVNKFKKVGKSAKNITLLLPIVESLNTMAHSLGDNMKIYLKGIVGLFATIVFIMALKIFVKRIGSIRNVKKVTINFSLVATITLSVLGVAAIFAVAALIFVPAVIGVYAALIFVTLLRKLILRIQRLRRVRGKGLKIAIIGQLILGLTVVALMIIVASPIFLISIPLMLMSMLFLRVLRMFIRMLSRTLGILLRPMILVKLLFGALALIAIMTLLLIIAGQVMLFALISAIVLPLFVPIMGLIGIILLITLIFGGLLFILGTFGGVLLPVIAIGALCMLVIYFTLWLIALMLESICKMELDPERLKTQIDTIVSSVFYILDSLFQNLREHVNIGAGEEAPWYKKLAGYILGANAAFLELIIAIPFLLLSFFAVGAIFLIAMMLEQICKVDIDPAKVKTNVDCVINTAMMIVRTLFTRDDTGDNPSQKGIMMSIISWVSPELADILTAIFAVAFLAVMVIAISLILLIATELRLLQILDLQPEKIKENVKTVIKTAQMVVDTIFNRDADDNTEGSDKDWIESIIGWFKDNPIVTIVKSIMAVAFLAVMIVAIFLVLLIATQLRLLQVIDLDPVKIKANVDMVLNTANEIANVFNRTDDKGNEVSKRDGLMGIIEFFSPELASIASTIFSIGFLAVTILAVNVVICIAQQLKLLQSIDLDADTVKNNLNLVLDTATLVNNVFDRTDNKPVEESKKTWFGKLLDWVGNNPLMKVLESVMAVGFLAMTLAAITIIKGIAMELATISNIKLDSANIKKNIDAVIKSCDDVASIFDNDKGIKEINEKDVDKFSSYILATNKIAELVKAMNSIQDLQYKRIKQAVTQAQWLSLEVKKLAKININAQEQKFLDWKFAKYKELNAVIKELTDITANDKERGALIEAIHEYDTFLQNTTKLDLSKLETTVNLFKQMTEFSESINGNFQGLADTVNDTLGPLLQELYNLLMEYRTIIFEVQNKMLDAAQNPTTTGGETPTTTVGGGGGGSGLSVQSVQNAIEAALVAKQDIFKN